MIARHLFTERSPALKFGRTPFVALLDDVLSQAECEREIERIESLKPSFAPITTHRGFVNRPDIRNNDRVIFDDISLARSLYDRISACLPPALENDNFVVTSPVGINERFRGYRYSPGQRFAPHFDGAFARTPTERSELTVLFYLNDGMRGGETRFNDWEVDVVPKRGQALLFVHNILHEGCLLEEGQKYVLRSDVMYRTL